MTQQTLQVDVHVTPGDLAAELHADTRAGLTSVPKELKPKYFYDDRGSELFDEITRLPEYYPTRREKEILTARASEVARITGARTLVELGSGTSEKTRLLLDALHDAGTLELFAPFDVSEGILRLSAEQINREYPDVAVHAVAGDFERHLHCIPDGRDRLVAFLGGTIGNFPPTARAAFLAAVGGSLRPGEWFLLGCDLVKDAGRLHDAYNDSRGVTAEFNKNVLAVLNRELRADFDLDAFEHVARWDPAEEWIEMLLVSSREQRVQVRELDLEVSFSAGEAMRTEISAKFRPDGVRWELQEAGLQPVTSWTDAAGDFGLWLARRT